jgi:hypothetical protein
MLIEGPIVARMIGKGRENMKRLNEETGAVIFVIMETHADQKPLCITGPLDNVEFAMQQVFSFIQEARAKLNNGALLYVAVPVHCKDKMPKI